MRQELEGFVTYRTPPNQGIPLATTPPPLRQEQTHINASPVETHNGESDESVGYIDDSWASSPSPGVSSRSSLSLEHGGMMAVTEWESIDETASSDGEAHQALPLPLSSGPNVQVIDLTSRQSEGPSSDVEVTPPTSRIFLPSEVSHERQRTLNVTRPGFITPPNSRIPILDFPPPPRPGSEQSLSPNLVNAQVLPALVSPPLLRVSALRNRLALRRQNAFARSRRVDTSRQARYIPLESPPQDPVTGFLDRFPVTPRVFARPGRVDTPRRASSTSHEVEEEVDEGIVDTTIDLTDSPTPLAPALDQSPPAQPPAGVLDTLRCPVCLDTLAAARAKGCRVLATTCGHIFCSACLPRCLAANSQCPTCRARLPGPNNYHNLYIE